MNRLGWSVAALAVVTMAGCGKKPPQPVPVPAQPTETAPPVDRSADEARRRAQEEEARRAAEETRRIRAILEEMVFFDYDQSALRADSKATLDTKLPILRQDATVRLRIEGHADDRGSTEYNMALGTRRAQAVKDYLVGFGVDAGRFELISYGEERPLVTGSGETSWARNRRGQFAVIGGPSVVDGQQR